LYDQLLEKNSKIKEMELHSRAASAQKVVACLFRVIRRTNHFS
jgi:hypothetical protein